METVKQEAEEVDDGDGDIKECQEEISPKNCQKLQFSIAQIMGFDNPDESKEGEDNLPVEDENIGEDSSQEHPPPSKLWRPQPHPPTQFPPDPATLALLRHYSLFRSNREPWRSNLLSSYAALMTPHQPKESFPPTPGFVFPTIPFQDPPKFVRGMRSSLGFCPGERSSGGRESDGKVEPVMQGKQKTYPCPQCGKVFNAHYNLTRHMPVHTGIHYSCE